MRKFLVTLSALAFLLSTSSLGSAQTIVTVSETVPVTAPTASAVGSGGSCTVGAHSFAYTVVTTVGGVSYETGLSNANNATCVASDSVSLSVIAAGSQYATARNVYATKAGTTFPFYYVAQIADNTTTTYTFTAADTALVTVFTTKSTVPPNPQWQFVNNDLFPIGDNLQRVGISGQRVKSFNNVAITLPVAQATLTIASGKTATVSNTLTFAGTDATVMTFPTTSATIARSDAANTYTGVQTMTSPAITTPAFTGAFSGTYNLAGTPTVPTAGIGFTNATSGSITVAAPTGALATPTVSLPALTGSLPTIYSCGASLAAAGACANTAIASPHFVVGSFLLSGSTSTVTGVSPAFTSATSWWCTANDITTRANPVQAIPASASSFVITNTTGATDLIQVICFGN